MTLLIEWLGTNIQIEANRMHPGLRLTKPVCVLSS